MVSKFDSRLKASMTVTVVSRRAIVCRPPISTLRIVRKKTDNAGIRQSHISLNTFFASSSVSAIWSSASSMAALNSAVKVSATCIGSLIPVLSMITYWISFCFVRRASSERRSPRRVQQMQPFCSWMSFSVVCETLWFLMRAASMLSLFVEDAISMHLTRVNINSEV